MNDIETLPCLIDQAMAALDNATTAAEVLDARDQAKVAYDAAKSAARFAKAKSAHATILATCHRMQADALTIEARAQSRLADEYDAAQGRGDVATPGNKSGKSNIPDENITPTAADIGLTSKQIHEARQVRDAEKREPGVIKRTLDAKLDAGEEPTRADVKRAVRQSDAPQTDGHADPDAIEIGRLYRLARGSYDEATQIEAAPTGDERKWSPAEEAATLHLARLVGRIIGSCEYLEGFFDTHRELDDEVIKTSFNAMFEEGIERLKEAIQHIEKGQA
jgi:hypothetical protein